MKNNCLKNKCICNFEYMVETGTNVYYFSSVKKFNKCLKHLFVLKIDFTYRIKNSCGFCEYKMKFYD